MKKFFSILFAVIFLSGTLISPSFASEKTKVYTLSEIRKLALSNAETLDTFQALYKKYEREMKAEEDEMGEKYKVYDDNGKEITKYLSGRTLSYDYLDKLDSFEKKIKYLKKQNELQAIRKYNEILSKEIEITKKNNAIDLAETDLAIAKKTFEVGQSTKLNYDLAKSNAESLKTELQVLRTDRNSLYEDMNRLIGLPKESRYRLDSTQLLTLTSTKDLKLAIPSDALAYVHKDSDLIKDLEKTLRERKKAFEIFLKTQSYDPETYRAKEKELDIDGIQKELKKNKNALYFDLEKDYLEILLSLIRLSDFKENMDFTTYQTGISKVKYQKGTISKRNYLQEEDVLLDLKNDYISRTLDAYQQILLYQIKTGQAFVN